MTYTGVLQGEFVNSRSCSAEGRQGKPNAYNVPISNLYRKIARAVPYYPKAITAGKLAAKLGIAEGSVRAALASGIVCQRYLVCQDGQDYCRLRHDLSNVEEE